MGIFFEQHKKPGPDPMLDLAYRSNTRQEGNAFYTMENKKLTFRFERTKRLFLFLYENGGIEEELLEANERLHKSEALERHLEQVIAQKAGSFRDSGELAFAVRDLDAILAEGRDPLDAESPWNYEGILRAYESHGPLGANKLLYVLTDRQGGGLGYRIRKGGFSLKRWEVDHDSKVITLFNNELGNYWRPRSNRSAADTLYVCISEEFFKEESLGTAVQRVGAGMLMVAGGSVDVAIGVIGFMVPEPTMATKVLGGAMIATGVSTFTEGASQIFHPNAHGGGFNPLEEGAGAVGHAVAGEKGEVGAKMAFRATTLVVAVGGSVKILRAAQTEAGVAQQIEAIRKEAELGAQAETVDTAAAAKRFSHVSSDAPESIQVKQQANAKLWQDAERVERDRLTAGRSVEEMNALIKGERPLGFATTEQYHQFMADVQAAAKAEGIPGPILLRGSSTTFFSESPSKPIGKLFTTVPSLKKSSDVDLALEAPGLAEFLKTRGMDVAKFGNGRVSTNALNSTFPQLHEVAQKWTEILGRKVNPVGIIDRKATYSSPTNFTVVPK